MKPHSNDIQFCLVPKSILAQHYTHAHLDGVANVTSIVGDGELRVTQFQLRGVVACAPLVLPLKLEEQRIVICSRETGEEEQTYKQY